MLGDYSDKAIAAKIRAMYRYRLAPADYEELMKKRTVGDVAVYLRDNTHYRAVLADADPAAVHRGKLENLLRGLQYLQYRRLVAYNYSGKRIYRYLSLREEIQALLALLRRLSSGGEDRIFGHEDEEAFSPGQWLKGETVFDLDKLGEIESWQALADLLGETPYGKLVRRFPPDQEGQIDLVGCEQAFYTYYYQELLTFADSELTGPAKKAMGASISSRVGHQNIVQTYRLKRFFGSGEEFIRRSLLPFRNPSQPLIDRMIAARDARELHALLVEEGLARPGEEKYSDYIENVILRMRAKRSRWELHNVIHPPVVFFAYMTYLEAELEDLINIIESVRYGVPAEEMRGIMSSQ